MLPPDFTTITGGLSLLLMKIEYEIKITLNYYLCLYNR